MTETTKTPEGKGTWFYTTLILVFIVVGLYAQNTMLIAANSGQSAADKLIQQIANNAQQQQPTQQQNQQAQQPSAPTKIDLGDAPFKGNANAPVTIVEFSDFQCPFCGSFFQATLPSIEKDYVATGKAKFVYKNFPLSFHPNAQPAALAAECAKEQGKFWEMHDLLFSNQEALSRTKYTDFAKQLGLDVTKFDSCVDSSKYLNNVNADFSQGQTAGVSGTPSFFIGNDKKGYTLVVGAQPYAAFKSALDAAAA